MKYIKTFEYFKNFENNPNGKNFIQDIKELDYFSTKKDVDRVIKMINDNPEYVNYINKEYYQTTPLNVAIEKLQHHNFKLDIIKALIDNDADVNLVFDSINTSLLYNAVASKNNLDVIKILI